MELDLDFRGDNELRFRIKWLTFIRVILVTILMGGTLAVYYASNTPLDSHSMGSLFSVIGLIYALSICYGITQRVSQHVKTLACLQFIIDPFLASAIIYVSGGVESVFTIFYIFSIFGSTIILGKNWALIVASLSSILYGLLVDLQFYDIIHPISLAGDTAHPLETGRIFYTMLSNIIAFYVIAFLGSYLQGQLSRVRIKLSQQSKNLMELEALNDRIVESIASGLLTMDRDGKILSFNTAAEQILGHSFKDVAKKSISEVIPELTQHPDLDPLNLADENKRPRGELTIKTSQIQNLCLGFSFSPLTSANGQKIGSIMIFQDITEIKKMQDEVKRLERLAIMGTLAAGMAHEIKNPLGAMSGAFQMLHTEDANSPIAHRLVSIIEREMHRLTDLLDEFLWLSKPVKRKETLKLVSLEPIVDDTITLIRSKIELNTGVQFEKHILPDCYIMVDESHFRQIIWNLLLNAFEAIDDQGSVKITTERIMYEKIKPQPSPFIKISVSDTGCGIQEEEISRIYEPFFTTKDTGTGLGLAIVQKIVDEHGGFIEIESKHGRGTIFSILLPEPAENKRAAA